jgi:cell wall-associated NlpC family hydrolase
VRPVARLAIAAATTLAVTLPISGAANAAPSKPPVPTQSQVDRAQAAVANKKQSVAQLEAALAGANARMDEASTAAEMAFERANGAKWRLQEAQKASRAAQLKAHLAVVDVANQRAGIVQLVTESYQNGTELNTASALVSDEGPTGLMNRYGVVQSAGDSMQASYDSFKIASARAKTYATRAAAAEKRQEGLAEEARKLAVTAGQAAAAASVAANQIAVQKQNLIVELAKAQNISVGLATRRHDALERIARQKAAAAAKAKQAAEQALLKKQAAEAKKKAKASKNDKHDSDEASGSAGSGSSSSGSPSSAPPPVSNPAPNQAVAIQRAIAYAKAQLGKPYRWGAAGPGTFDCSGLTLQAWARGGKYLPHYSVAQFAQSTRVSMADARAGDLLFWSSNGSPNGIHHVALYLGGGQFIEAPHTGANVRYNSIYNWYPDFVARP